MTGLLCAFGLYTSRRVPLLSTFSAPWQILYPSSLCPSNTSMQKVRNKNMDFCCSTWFNVCIKSASTMAVHQDGGWVCMYVHIGTECDSKWVTSSCIHTKLINIEAKYSWVVAFVSVADPSCVYVRFSFECSICFCNPCLKIERM